MEKCKKCGQSDISVKFMHEGAKVYWSEHNEIKNLDQFTKNDTYYSSDRITKECLVYKCKTCGYKEATKPLSD